SDLCRKLAFVSLDSIFSCLTPYEIISKVELVCRHWRTVSKAGCGWTSVKLLPTRISRGDRGEVFMHWGNIRGSLPNHWLEHVKHVNVDDAQNSTLVILF